MSDSKIPVARAALHQSPPTHIMVGFGTKTTLVADKLPQGIRLFWDIQGLWWSKGAKSGLIPAPAVQCVSFATPEELAEEPKVVKKSVKVTHASA